MSLTVSAALAMRASKNKRPGRMVGIGAYNGRTEGAKTYNNPTGLKTGRNVGYIAGAFAKKRSKQDVVTAIRRKARTSS